MGRGSDILSDIKAGISQSERQLPALVPEHVKIEERDIPDFLKFITELSTQINYYNFANVREGDWQDFFKSDVYILISLVGRFDLNTNLNRYNKLMNDLNLAESDEELLKKLQELFQFILRVVGLINLLQEEFGKTYNSGDIADFAEIIHSFKEEIARLAQYNREAVEELGPSVKISLKGIDNLTAGASSIFKTGSTIKENIFNALPYLTKLFNDFHAKYNHLLAVSNNYLKKTKLFEREYEPHIALLITFLQLYQHLKHKINGITRRHLDFYYSTVLGIERVKAKPDKVSMLFDIDPALKSLTILSSEKLEARIPGREKPEYYQLSYDRVMTNAKIAELKTVFVSDYKHYENRHVTEAQVFKADNPVFSPAAYLKTTGEPVTWPLLGEDQHDLAANLRTMQDTDIGLVMASPLFYQAEGERTVQLSIHFKPASFQLFKNDVGNFALATEKKRNTALLELLNTAFVIDYTTTDGWQAIDRYYASCDMSEHSDHTITISFKLGATQKPVDVYNAAIHQQSYSADFPLVRILVNNYASHNPYTFFRKLLIDRVSIKVAVHGFQDLKLQNNIGALSKAHPFQVFGPQPTVGSFLNVKNTNVFNKYTTDFCCHIEWLDLPKDKGGFASYYDGYGTNVSNDSFVIGLSAMQGGSFRPDPQSQQAYQLFETDRDNDVLKNKTDIKHVDFKKIEFPNAPGLAAEHDVSESAFKEGVIRFELLSPPDAFGHRLFPQIFPEIVMNNAKMFRKKRPLPNQPYIPMVKSISVDFTLKHTENFAETSNEPETDLLLIHQHPFGHELIYPHNDKKTYAFMPQFDQACNLYIGLDKVEPNQELSMLFYLEEKNFHHTLHKPDQVSWSYLEGNTWYALDRKDVLYDATDNFMNSGIIIIKMPPELRKGNTILNGDLFWLRASIGSAYVQPRVTAIYTNAATASRIVPEAEEAESDFSLPANSIKSFTRNVKGVQNVWQLFPSFGGRPKETKDKYYVRVSERLRHNQRPVQMEDVIQVVLEQFPEILMVKCFGNDQSDHLVLPGIDLQVVVIPKEREDGRFISQQPRVNLATLYHVKSFLEGLISPFIKVEVGNPVYEKVKVICKVMINDKTTSDYGVYIRLLSDEINRYIAPWLYGESEDLKIGSKIYKSDILLFIKERPYVAYVTEFSAVHFYSSEDVYKDELNAEITDTADAGPDDHISGSTPAAVLIPATSHKITIINKPGYEEPKTSGIGTFTIGEEMLVTDKAEEHTHEAASKRADQDDVFTLTITHNLD